MAEEEIGFQRPYFLLTESLDLLNVTLFHREGGTMSVYFIQLRLTAPPTCCST